MKAARWWAVPLALALVLDAALAARFEASPAMAVGRAIVRTARGGTCRQAVVLRGQGLDRLFIVDTWVRQGHLVEVPSTVDFSPGLGLTPQSRRTIREGLEVDLSRLTGPFPTPKVGPGLTPLLGAYRQQVGAGDSWLQGPCLPFANPFQSRLHKIGAVASQGTAYTEYLGAVHGRGGFQMFPDAEVWVGVRAGGRIGFELLRQQPSAGGNPALQAVATLFTYPRSHMGRAFARETPTQREAFYGSVYRQVLSTMAQFRQAAHGTPL